MDENIEFSPWDTPGLSKEDKERLLDAIEKKYHRKEIQKKIGRTAVAALVVAAVAVSSVFYIHKNSYRAQVADLRGMLEKEITTHTQAVYYASGENYAIFRMEDRYDKNH